MQQGSSSLQELSQRALSDAELVLPAQASLLARSLTDDEVAVRPDLAEERERLRSKTHIVIAVISGAQRAERKLKRPSTFRGADDDVLQY